MYATNEPEIEFSYRDQIRKIIECSLFTDPITGSRIAKTTDTKTLIENAHVLAKSGLYEEVIQELINCLSSPNDFEEVEKVDSYLRPFVMSERKSRARLKLNYILAGATSNRLERAIQLLVEGDEIDDALLAYVDAVITKESVRGGGPTALAEEERGSVGGVSKDALEVLQLVRKRLRAELYFKQDGRAELRLLAKLVSEPSLETREKFLRESLNQIEQVDAFSAILQEAIAHIANADTSKTKPGATTACATTAVGTLERMRDVGVSLERLRARLSTGLRDDSQFSTSPEDYTDKL